MVLGSIHEIHQQDLFVWILIKRQQCYSSHSNYISPIQKKNWETVKHKQKQNEIVCKQITVLFGRCS